MFYTSRNKPKHNRLLDEEYENNKPKVTQQLLTERVAKFRFTQIMMCRTQKTPWDEIMMQVNVKSL